MKGVKLLSILIIIISITGIMVYVGTKNNTTEPDTVLIQVTSEQFRFIPNKITVDFGTDVTLNITSVDVTHGFQIDEFNILNVVVPAGESVQVNFVANQRGEFYFYCTVLCGTGHADHIGTLIVE